MQSLQQSLMKHSTRSLCLSCLYAFLTQDPPCMYSPHLWRACARVLLEGMTLWVQRQPLPSTAEVMCLSPLLGLLLLFVRWPFDVMSGSSVSLLHSPKWDQAKGWFLGSIMLDRNITFSRCLGLNSQFRLGDVDCQFRLIKLSMEVDLAIVYLGWRGDAEPRTPCGPQLEQTLARHGSKYRACKFSTFGKRESCQCFLGSCHSQLSLTDGHQFRSETHDGLIWSSSTAGLPQSSSILSPMSA